MKATILLALSVIALSFGSGIFAGENNAQSLSEKINRANITIKATVNGCDADIAQFCNGLQDNPRKSFMCLTAYEEQLNPQCRQSVLEAALAIKMGTTALDYSINACEIDANRFCLEVQPGEGRLIKCIKTHQAQVSPQCLNALKDTGFWNLAP